MRQFFSLLILGSLFVFFATADEPLGSKAKTAPKGDGKKESDTPKYVSEIDGKKLDYWVKQISYKLKVNHDASKREAALALIPLFDPEDSHKLVDDVLLEAFLEDPDHGVRMTAMSVITAIGFADQAHIDRAINRMIALVRMNSIHTKMEALTGLQRCGPLAKKAIPDIVESALHERTSWQLRKAAANTLMIIARASAAGESSDNLAITKLIISLNDQCEQVRKQVIDTLIVLGKPENPATLTNLKNAFEKRKKAKEESTTNKIWCCVGLIRLNPKNATSKDTNVVEIKNYLASSTVAVRFEAIRAIGTLASEVDFLIPELQSIVENDKEVSCRLAALGSLITMDSRADLVTEYLEKYKTRLETEGKTLKTDGDKNLNKNMVAAVESTIKLIKDRQKALKEMKEKEKEDQKNDPNPKDKKSNPKKGKGGNPVLKGSKKSGN